MNSKEEYEAFMKAIEDPEKKKQVIKILKDYGLLPVRCLERFYKR